MGQNARSEHLVHLPAGPIEPLHEALLEPIRNFDCLDWEPAKRAKEWLLLNIRAGRLPMHTYLVMTEDASEVLGFFVLELAEVHIARGDMPIIEVRHKVDDPDEAQRAVKLVWIARSEQAPEGFGSELFDEALLKALEADAVAVLVEPFDETTAEKLWIDHFGFRKPRPNREHPSDWTYLWHTVRAVDQPWG